MKTFLKKNFLMLFLCFVAISSFAEGQGESDENLSTAVVVYKEDVATLDPAIGYDWQNWSMIKTIFGRLMDYVPGTTELEPSVAESFQVSDDGLTYTFKLREDVLFHNGRSVTAEDVVYSINRTVNPETQSPGAGFYTAIVGYDEFTSGASESLAGVKAIDDFTVEFSLSRPDAAFLHIMALNFSSIVPSEAVDEWGLDFGKHPVGSGPYKLSEWKSGQYLIFSKNEDYFIPGVPYIDRYEIQIGVEPLVALLKVEQGEADIAGDGIPPAKFVEYTTDPELSKLIVSGGQLHTGYVALNVRISPFDKLAVRQAVNMAIDKERIVKLINNRAVPANQPLPPMMPGYDTEYTGYDYNPDAAKKLLSEAGLGSGFSTELFVANVDPQPRIAQAIQQDLSAIGIDVEIRSIAGANVIAAGGEADQAPMVWSGGLAWIADFPDPSNFYWPILGGVSAVPGGWNWSWYANDEMDNLARKADSMTDPAMADERTELWSKIFTTVMDDAPWIPLFNENRYTVRSERLEAEDSIFVDPVHIPFNYAYVKLKAN